MNKIPDHQHTGYVIAYNVVTTIGFEDPEPKREIGAYVTIPDGTQRLYEVVHPFSGEDVETAVRRTATTMIEMFNQQLEK